MKIIGISGRKGHGKDTVGQMIQYLVSKERKKGYSYKEYTNEIPFLLTEPEWEIRKFALRLKYICADLVGVNLGVFTDEKLKDSELKIKRIVINEHGLKKELPLTPRWLMQYVGTELARNINENIWIDSLFTDFKEKGSKWIITDVRFKNEFEAIKQRGGIVIRVQKEKYPKKAHISETELDSHAFDYVLNNNGTIDDLLQNVRIMLEDLELLE